MNLAEKMKEKAVSKKPLREEMLAAAKSARRRLARSSPGVIEEEVAFQLSTGMFGKWLTLIDAQAAQGARCIEFLLGFTSDPHTHECRLQATDLFREKGFRVHHRTAQRVYTDKRRHRREPEELFLFVSW